ncbi:hypothetical protein C7T94_19190, partial [Pedobacter yulinensis]
MFPFLPNRAAKVEIFSISAKKMFYFFLLFLFSFSHLPFLPNRAAKVANFLASARNILKYFLPA